MMDLRDKALPIEIKSQTDTCDPNLVCEKTEMPLPYLMNPLKDKVEPKVT
jgi:hypothetical protein